MRRGLVAQGLARLPDLLALQRAMAGLEGTLQELTGQVDRATATLYLHCLDKTGEEVLDEVRARALRAEAGIIRAIGSTEDLELVRQYPDSAPPYADLDDYRHHPPHIHRPSAGVEEGGTP